MKKMIALFILSSALIAEPAFADQRKYENLILSVEQMINSSSKLKKENQIEMLQEAAINLSELLKIKDFDHNRAQKALDAINARLKELNQT
jgi:hypothetical protein